MSALEDAARNYVSAYKASCDANRPSYEVTVALEVALHDLVLAAGERCVFCDEGTCPGIGPMMTDGYR